MAEKRIKPECIEWTAKGTCAKFRFTEEKGLVTDLKACKLEEKEKMIKEIKRGFQVEE
ncbi:hypothetical protein ES703_61556 [subsurface metagenome]